MRLEVDGLSAAYGRIEALHSISMRVEEGEIVAVLGANGAGKSTFMNTIAGVHPALSGSIRFNGINITRMPAHARVSAGIVLVPEGRHVFAPLSVADNLQLGGFCRGGASKADRKLVEDLFPILSDRPRQAAGNLSGGQQQMLALSRALMSQPKLLLLDEPSMGLAPVIVQQIFAAISALHRASGLTVIVVEQNISAALELADRAYVLETGTVAAHGSAAELKADETIQRAYLGL